MVGSGRKRKKEEKAKTQLKKPKTAPGKHLPKGTNETKTSFKVAKIVVPGQKGEAGSQGSAGGPVTNKKLTLKDVLGKISHFSNAVRTDGLEGLKELLTGASASALVSSNLSSILGALMPVVQDRERKMRKLATGCISEVMLHTPASSLAPLHSLLSAHLCCALTHIDPRIQQDALNTLDCLLKQAPSFIKDTAALLLPNCLDQISAKKQGAPGTAEKKSSSGPNIAANLSETMSSLQWRLNVLSRIENILEIVTPASLLAVQSPLDPVKFTPGASFSIFTCSPPTLPLSSLSTSSTSSSIQQHLTSVLPLLLETWVEARAEEEKEGRRKSKSSTLTKEQAELLTCETGILNKLLRLMEDKVLGKAVEKFGSDLQTHFLNPLPYSCPSAPLAETNVLLSVVAINLAKIPSSEVSVLRFHSIFDFLRAHIKKMSQSHLIF